MKGTYEHPEDGGGELPALVGLLLKVTGGGGVLGAVGGGLLGGGAERTIVVAPDPGDVAGELDAGDCGAYQGCRPTDCIQAILSHLIVCQSSVTNPPVSPAHVFSETMPQASIV